MGWPTRRPLWCLLWWGFAAQGLKRTFCTFSLFYRGCRAGCSPFFGSQLTLPWYCPQCLWNLCTYSPNGSRRSYFFQLFSRLKVGLNPSLMLKSASLQWVCISPQRPWCFCLCPGPGNVLEMVFYQIYRILSQSQLEFFPFCVERFAFGLDCG